MIEKEKELKSFNQCADALSSLDKKGILKVFHMLSIHFEVVPFLSNSNEQKLTNEEQEIDKAIFLEESPKSTAKKSVKISNTAKKSKSTNSSDVEYLTDYDFRLPGSEALKDFYAQYKSTSNMENNLIFTYYLQEKRKEKQINMNHIFSCYRHLGLKLPSFPSTLFDTKRLKGWIDTANQNDIKVTRAGINYMEHEIAKSND